MSWRMGRQWNQEGEASAAREVLRPRRVPNEQSRARLEVLEERCLLTGPGSLGDALLEWIARRPAPAEYRSLDGTGNNLANTEWGSTFEQLLRKAAPDYGDNMSSPSGSNRPSPRQISNTIVAHDAEELPNERQLSSYSYVWGQFLDHDLDLTGGTNPAESFNIVVPTNDPYFDPAGTGTQVIPLNRSEFDPTTGNSKSNPRKQTTQITAWIDGSMIYGSDTVRAATLRTHVGGRLLTSPGPDGVTGTNDDLLPYNTFGLANDNPTGLPANQLFAAGDVRANENIELTSMHTLFVREHNRIAARIAAANSSLSDDEVYQRARTIVVAEIQAITYNEWLPSLLGRGALDPYWGYSSRVNPSIADEFSTAAFRLHTLINDDVEFFGNDGRGVRDELELREAFGNPAMVATEGIDEILKYVASAQAEEVDNQLVGGLRNFLFGEPGSGGLDLASLNIQRGRDHGLADYNTTRAAYGLPRVTRFSQISSDPEIQQKLKDLYGNVNNIDLWVGGLAEDHVPGSSFGPTVRTIMADQFERLRDGDRFWYERSFSGLQLYALEQTTLADIIERNTTVEGLQDNVFFFRSDVSGQVFFDRDRDGVLDRGELGLPGVHVDLLNDEGDPIASTVTVFGGFYHFDDLHETGDHQIRIFVPRGFTATTDTTKEFLIPTGDTVVRNVNFGLTATVWVPTIEYDGWTDHNYHHRGPNDASLSIEDVLARFRSHVFRRFQLNA
jgi:peroxidase